MRVEGVEKVIQSAVSSAKLICLPFFNKKKKKMH